jgi:hexosaminidase
MSAKKLNSVGVNNLISFEQKMELYAAFRFNSPNPALNGLNKRPNESYYESDFEHMQQACASRGVTIIPEIEAPGHALVITQWKPELALDTDFSLLNISIPETIPTMQSIWGTFLPWMHSKTVHLGADEYTASVAEYTMYVNTMHDYIQQKFSKNVRIWGTFPPSLLDKVTNVNTNVSIQHWEFFEANPYFAFIKNGYHVLNSDDAFYVVNKWSGSYPQVLNLTRVFHGAPGGGPYAPNIFDTSNSTNNPPRDSPFVLGHLPALWNDFGPNSTAVIEAYYALRDGLPALGDKQWGGDLLMSEYESIFETLHAAIPGQNLDRIIPSKSATILSYDFSSSKNSKIIVDKSGNGYDASVNCCCEVSNSILTLNRGCSVNTPLTSKGKNYTLSFSIKPTARTPGTLFSGTASTLLSGHSNTTNVMFMTGGNAYILNYTLPINIWTDVSVVGIGNATYLSVKEAGGPEEVHEFTAVIGDLSNSFIWNNPMAIEAPLKTIGGDTFEGEMKTVTLKDGADKRFVGMAEKLVIGIAPYT